jgi:uncharacterized damage-inducible protein DinB
MKELTNKFASYNLWANKQIIHTILLLDTEKQMSPLNSSFPSLYDTLYHILDAESIWWQRLKLIEHLSIPSNTKNLPILELTNTLLEQSNKWEQWVSKATESMLQHEFIYQTSKKQTFKQPVWQMLLHLFNHGTYHRGQIVTMLHQLDLKEIPPTDMIVFLRSR